MRKDFDLVVIGDLNADLILQGEDPVPAFGQVEKLVDVGVLTVGGSCGITACGAQRLGLRTACVGVLGNDVLGSFMRSALTAESIDVSACPSDPNRQTGISVILTRPGGEGRAILTAPGTIEVLTVEDIQPDILERSRHIHCGAYFLQPKLHGSLSGFFRSAREMGVTCSLDTNWDPSERWDPGLHDLLETCDLFFPNEGEALRITRRQTVEEALAALADLGPTVAMKLGEAGGVVQSGDGRAWASSPAVSPVDTTGAGDSFNAGYLHGFLKGWVPGKCLTLAVACGSLSTRALGGTGAQPNLDEAMRLAADIPVTVGEV